MASASKSLGETPKIGALGEELEGGCDDHGHSIPGWDGTPPPEAVLNSLNVDLHLALNAQKELCVMPSSGEEIMRGRRRWARWWTKRWRRIGMGELWRLGEGVLDEGVNPLVNIHESSPMLHGAEYLGALDDWVAAGLRHVQNKGFPPSSQLPSLPDTI
ncbi:hypothetical protein M407DRAFT_229845 [Tulasnella calospora MUT 4182]|uniref:Uncharacterized protein n=1 Tax=Tulasnella calospora MUT 4182 TaxID=1051891 RepID=A0A0C3QCZ5_9AGAM|nr:hypothetical protein M407DRAFT_229845 [Tulasnella calospora MUT 4182]